MPSWWNYDVFLSFTGEIRHGFISHLYNALTQSGINTFMDDPVMERGEDISRSLSQAIESSRIALVIFSPHYASSRWCLNELLQIMACQRIQAQVVMPIFYGVDPSDVRHERGTYGESMEKHQQRFGRKSDRLLRWREALKEAANISGWHYLASAHRPESKLIENIVEEVLNRIDLGKLFVAEHPVGLELRVHELTVEWSEKISGNAMIIGLWGMGGVGKTTVAKEIYNKIGSQFRARSFIANIRENSKHANDLVNLQKQLIFDITKTQIFKIPSIDRGKEIIHERLPNIKAFVVLDDVDSVDQLKALCGSREWFHPGSVIIITTRDLRLLNVFRADHKYKMREMNTIESLELFSWHAFKQVSSCENFIELSKNVVSYCGGLPLALEVLGSYLFDREIEEWEDVLSKLQSIPNKDINAKLKISYNGLNDYMEKDIFLDICCFFINKDRNYVTQILDGCGLHAKNGLQILIERSLIKVDMNNKLEMHDLLQAMGKEIIRESPPKDPEERSRLWFHEDVLNVLTEHIGSKAIEGISLKVPRTHRQYLIDSQAFKEMKKLRLLQLDFVNLSGDYKYLSKNLRWLCWHGFPLKYTPNNFCQKKLVAIDLKYSNLKVVWKEPQLLEMLKTLNLSHSSYLTCTPDFIKLPNLERLVMKDCQSLMLIHQSIGDLKNLLHVNLKDCKSLRDLPKSIYKVKSLKTLILSGCLLIDHLEEDIEQMESMTVLKIDNTAITTIPKSLARLEGLKHGYVSFPGHEGRAQDIFPSLIWSWMSPTNIPQPPTEAFWLSISSLVSSVVQNGNFHSLSPFLGDLAKLRGMWEEYSPQSLFNGKMARLLDALYGTNFMELESSEGHDQVHNAGPVDSFGSLLIQMAVSCKVHLLRERILQVWNNGGYDDSDLPGDQYPHWFVYKGEGRSIVFKVPQVIGCRVKAMLLNVVYSCCLDNTTSTQFLINVLIINYTMATVEQHKGHSVTSHEDEQWKRIISSLQSGDLVELVLSIGPQFSVKKIVAYLIFT